MRRGPFAATLFQVQSAPSGEALAEQGTAHRASKPATREIEPLGDKSLPMDEQQRRKRRLTQGPKEFRDIRADLPREKK